MQAIVYKSQTGHTKAYAGLLAEETGLPAYDAGEALEMLAKGTSIIFMSWIKAGDIVAYDRFAKRYDIKAVAVVGINVAGGRQIERVKKRHWIKDLSVFYLRGGIDLKKLHGIERKMLQMMQSDLAKAIKRKEKKNQLVTDEEKDMLNSLIKGGSYVKRESLNEIVSWYREGKT